MAQQHVFKMIENQCKVQSTNQSAK